MQNKYKLKFYNKPNNLGNQRLNSEKQVTRKREKIIAKNKGSNGFITFSMVVFATPTPTKSTDPTGGVHKPIDKFKTIIIPNFAF